MARYKIQAPKTGSKMLFIPRFLITFNEHIRLGLNQSFSGL